MKKLKQLLAENKIKNGPVPDSLSAIMENQIDILKGGGRKFKNKSKPAIKPSSIGCPCIRKIYYDYNRVEADYPFPLAAKKILIVGDVLGDLMADLLRKAGVLVDYKNKGDGKIPKSRFGEGLDPEFPLKDKEFEISAKIDAICIINNKLVIGEFKTINAKGFDKLQEPKEDHLLQSSIYAKLFGVALRRGDYAHIPELRGFTEVSATHVFYLKKDNTDFKEYKLTKEQITKGWNEVLRKSDLVRKHTKEQTCPEKTWYFCDGCQFRDKCRKDFVVLPEEETIS